MPQHAYWLVVMAVHKGVVKNEDGDGDDCEEAKCDFSRDCA